MNQEATIELFQYWNRLRDGRPAPRRTEIEPADIKSLLADTFILERGGRGDPVFRLAGTRLCAAFGRELKGYSFPLIWSIRDQRMVSRLAGSVFRDNAVILVTFDGISMGGKTNPFEMLLLPLEGGLGSQRLLGAFIPAKKPYWLGADPIVENRIDTLRVIDPGREPMFLKNRPPVPMPPHARSSEGGGALPLGDGGRRIRHLVVFEGGRST